MSNAPKTEKSRLRASESPTLPKALIVWVILVLVIWGFLLLAISPIPMWLDSALLSLLKSWGTQELYLRALVYSVMLASVITVIRLAWTWGKKFILGPGGVPSIPRLAIVWGILAISAPIILYYFFGRKAQAQEYILVISLVTVIVGGWVATKRGQISEEQQRMETFTRAVEQVSNEKKEVIVIAGLQILARLADRNKYDSDFITRIGNFLQSYINSITISVADVKSDPRTQTAIPLISVADVKSDPNAKDKRKPNLEAAAIKVLGDVTQIARDLSPKSHLVKPWRVTLINRVLRGVNLSGINLQEADLREAELQDAILEGTNLQKANLYGTILQTAVLRKANLREAGFYWTDLRRAELQMANLQGAELWKVKLQSTELRMANLQGARLSLPNKEAMKDADVWKADFRNATHGTRYDIYANNYSQYKILKHEGELITKDWLKKQGAKNYKKAFTGEPDDPPNPPKREV